jgi:queuine tRNA-ribosyltransferase subunit QTRTD1
MYYRVRGYHFKSEKGESRKNPAAYRSLDDAKEKLAEAALPSPSVDAQDPEKHGFAEKLG